MAERNGFSDTGGAIRSASALIEAAFLQAGRNLEESVGILETLTSGLESVLVHLEGERPRQALTALSGMAARVTELGQDQAREIARFEHMHGLTRSIGARVTQMTVSLKDVDCLAVNSKIAAANINVPGTDFMTFAGEIGRTLQLARSTLDRFHSELNVVSGHVVTAHARQRTFEQDQQDAARSITERLAATVMAIASQHQRAARASLEVKLGSARVRQRIRDAIVALQIGDITRQRLEHADHTLDFVAATRTGSEAQAGYPAPVEDERRSFVIAAHGVLSAQLADAARNFDHDVGQIAGSLDSLAAEAQGLRQLSNAVYGRADQEGGSFIAELEGQVGEALTLFEGFETARAEVAGVTAAVSGATGSLGGYLRTVETLESDLRIMGLNTTFRCARIGRDGLALSVVAQELRAYANGFAKEAAGLMSEVESLARLSGPLNTGAEITQAPGVSEETSAMRESLVTLQRMEQVLDAAMVDLERDCGRVVTLLTGTVAALGIQSEIGSVLRDAAESLAVRPSSGPPFSFTALAPGVEKLLEAIESGYTMASERLVHDRVLCRSVGTTRVPIAAAAADVGDFLF